MLVRVKNHKCCGGVISRQREPSKFRRQRAEVAGGNDDDAAGIEMALAQSERLARVRQVLDDVEHDDDVEHAEAGQGRLVGHTAR